MDVDEKQPFMSHLEELRKRLINCAISVGLGFIICYLFKEELFKILMLPLKNQMPEGDRVIFTNLPEMFFTYIKTAFVGGIVLSSPFIFHQLWLFIAPGLYQHEKRYLIPFVLSSSLLFLAGTLFAYFVVCPFGFKFFLGFANDYIQALPSVKQYFSFSIK
ncbi:MAG TPA: twin-arginine translocase subunit TatC, partial [Desulfobacteraceae bacterium]|nr:twin-arginine translocase subunit TatC [Desulfobacteraceae bacterium]